MSPAGPSVSFAFHRIAAEIDRRIAAGQYAVDDALPSESALAEEFGVARGTVRRALEELESERQLLSRRGTRWIVHQPTRPRDFGVLRSFGQWAIASGMTIESRTVRFTRGRATGSEAAELGVRRLDPVARIVRVRSLDGRAVMVERTTFAAWVADFIAEIPDDARSIMEVVERDHGVTFAFAKHRITAMSAGAEDARLLGVRRSAPLLRAIRTVWTAEGRVWEVSDDRYVAGSVALSLVNSWTSSPDSLGIGSRSLN